MRSYIYKIIIACCSLLPMAAWAQLKDPYEMNISGVKVIVQPSGNDIVEVLSIIKGGVYNYTADKAGIENLAITALTECGTVKDDKNSFKNKLDKVSAQVAGGAGRDFSTFRMNCIRADLDQVWPLYVDALTQPRFDAKEFARMKQDAITGLKAEESNPDAAIDQLSMNLAFAGKAYAKRPQGTVATVSKLTAEETKAFYKKLLNRGRLTIVVVGEVPRAELEQKISAMLERIPAGQPFVVKKDSYTPPANTIKPEQKDIATNYIKGITGAPQPGTSDYNAFVLAMRIFGTRHFVEVRSNQGLSYAPNAWFSGGLTPYANLYVTTTEPDKYIAVARNLIEKIKREGFTEKELKDQKTGYVTEVYYRQETNNAQAYALANNEVVHGNWKRAYTVKDDMQKVSLADLNRVFNKYITNITWAYQGDPKKVNQALYIQKEAPPLPKDVKTF